MGLELYIAPLGRPSFEKFDKLLRNALKSGGSSLADSHEAQAWWDVEVFHRNVNSAAGCFRDTDNSWSLLWRLGLDFGENVLPLCDHGHLKAANLREFRDMVANRKLKLPTELELKKLLPSLGTGQDALLQEWRESLLTRHQNLLSLLNRAIELAASITWNWDPNDNFEDED